MISVVLFSLGFSSLPSGGNLAEVASANGLTTLFAAASQPQSAGVLTALQDPATTLTVLAPSNDAFSAFFTASNITAEQALALDSLPSILLGHTLGSVQTSVDLTAKAVTAVNTLGPNMVLALYDSDANVLTVAPTKGGTGTVSIADVQATNGIAHVIDAVIDINANLAAVADTNGLSTLVAAASQSQSAGVFAALQAPTSRLTVFAPTNDAFSAFFTASNITAEQALALDSLPNILLGHAVQGLYTSVDLMAAPSTSLTTLAGTTITIEYDSSSGTITITPAVGGTATVAIADVGAANGIAHVITSVLEVHA